MSKLADLIVAERNAITRDWITAVERSLAPQDASWQDTRDHVPELLGDMADKLRTAASRGTSAPPLPHEKAQAHGRQRSRVGFDLRSVVDEFALLQDVILERAESTQAQLTLRDLRALARLIAASVRDSTEAFLRERSVHEAELTDVAKRAQAQLTLASRVAKLGFFDFDLRTGALELNAQMQKDWQLASPTTLDAALKRLHRDDRERVADAINDAIHNRTPYHAEYRIMLPDNTPRWVEASGHIDYADDGTPLRFLGTVRDVSAQAGQRQWLENVLNELPMPLVMVKPGTGSHVFSNRAADAMYGSTIPKATDPATYGDYFYVTDTAGRRLSADEVPSTRAARGEVIDKAEYVWHTPQGEFDIVISGRCLPAMYGHDAMVVCPFQDVTAVKEAQKKLHAAVQRLEDEAMLREHFVAALSHDLRTPLAAASLAAQLLKRRADQPQRVEKAAQRIVSSLGRVEAMIRDILDANRLKAGEPLELKPEVCQLDQFLQGAVADLQQLHGQRVVLKAPCPPITGLCDPGALLRVVDNLVNNAVKYGDEAAPIELSLSQQHGAVTLAVHNEGPPIAQGDQKTLFEPYYRTTSARRGKQKGWGIGLALVREISQAHGGSVAVSSNAKSGTTFTVRLPLASRLNNFPG